MQPVSDVAHIADNMDNIEQLGLAAFSNITSESLPWCNLPIVRAVDVDISKLGTAQVTSVSSSSSTLNQLKLKVLMSRAQKLVSCAKRHTSALTSSCGSSLVGASKRNLNMNNVLMPKIGERRTSSGLFVCSTCGCSFNTKYKLRQHEFLHTTDRPYICHTCGKSYRFRTSLNEHSQSAHINCANSTRSFLCDLCGDPFPSPIALRRHVNRQHINRRAYVCSKCDKRYATNWQLKEHMRSCQSVDGTKPYVCSKCNASFTLRWNMLRHERLHGNVLVHACPFCSKVFRQKYNVLQHVRRMHATANSQQNAKVPNICTVCNKKFFSEVALERHALMHVDGGRRYVCQTCRKGFTQMRYLTAHLVVHRDKQNICPVCARRFLHHPRLVSHVKKKHPTSSCVM